MSQDTCYVPFDRNYIKKLTKNILRNRIFVGSFQEKRYVDCLKDYRHVIRISLEEQQFIKTLLRLKKRIQDCYLKGPWIGITEPGTVGAPEGFNLWVVLPEEILGNHHYKVCKVEFLHNEIRLKVDALTPVKENNSSNLQHKFKIYYDFLTIPNCRQAGVFIFVLMTVLAGSLKDGINYLFQYLLKLIREISNFVIACTPISLSLINFVGKIINKPQPIYRYKIVYILQPQSSVKRRNLVISSLLAFLIIYSWMYPERSIER